LRDDGIPYSQGAIVRRTTDVSLAFLKHVSAGEKNARACKQNMQEVGFYLHEAALRTLCSKYIQE
jgi:hypothetical protein